MILWGLPALAAPKTYQLPPATYQRATEYRHRLTATHFVEFAWKITVLAGLAGTGAARKIRDRVRTPAAAVAGLLVVYQVTALPLAIYRHWLSVDYGISVEPWGAWFADILKLSLATGALIVPSILLLFALSRHAGWWIRGWIMAVVILIAGVYATPVLFDPLFHDFRPLGQSHPALVKALQDVAARVGYKIPAARILEVDASRETRAVNAYLTGFGNSQRIVIWDTSIAALTVPQIQTVFAHEVGHEALHHVPRSLAWGALALFGVFSVAGRVFRCPLDTASLPKIFAFVVAAAFLSEPAVNAYSRSQEHRADIYELSVMCGLVPDAGLNSAEVDQIMGAIDLEDPGPSPFIKFWLFDHPPVNERMRFAQQYGPCYN